MLSLDFIIFVGLLTIYLFFGFIYRPRHNRLDDCNEQKGKFATSKIVATITLSWLGAGFLFLLLTETIRGGIYCLLPHLGGAICIIISGFFILPRMSEFIGLSSVAEAAKELWGGKVAFIATICYILFSLGILTLQLQHISIFFEYFGPSRTYSIIISGIIVAFYCLIANNRTANFSDIIQFITFCLIVPTMSFATWKALTNNQIIWATLKTQPNFNFNLVFSLDNPMMYSTLLAFMMALIPKFGPLTFQATSMSRDVKQATQAFKIGGLILLIFHISASLRALSVVSHHPELNPNDFGNYVLNNYLCTGYRGVIAISVTSVTMSVAYFLINTSTNMLIQYILKPSGLTKIQNPRFVLLLFSIFTTITSIYLAIRFIHILPLLKIVVSIYSALISTPFLLAIFGFRSSEISVLIGIIASMLCMLVYQWKFDLGEFDFFIPGMLTNIIFLFGSHYLLRQQGGWLGIKGAREFEEFKQEKRRKKQQFLHDTFDISFLGFCKQGLPTSAANITFFGLFALVSIFLTQISLPNIIVSKNITLLDFIYPSAFILAANLVLYPIWPQVLKKVEFLSIVWLLSVLYISIVIPTILTFISNFLPIQMVIALVNLIAVFVMFKWNIALFLLIMGGLSASLYLYCCADYINTENLQLQISYLLLFLGGALITFLKPNKDEKKNLKLLSDVTKQIRELSEQTLNLLIVKKDIINNFKQEIQSPIESIGAGAVTLNQNKNTLEKHTRDSAELIYREYRNLQKDLNKLVDLSRFNAGSVTLNYQDINFEELVENAINLCKSGDFKNPDLNFKINVQAIHLIITCDRDKIFQCLEYLIRNALNFTEKGTIEVLLENQDTVINETMTSTIKCSIIDEGIGIPENELEYIFGPFAKSSYTKNSSKGLGLALCQRIIELHHGTIWAENNKTKPGTTFTFIIPRRAIST